MAKSNKKINWKSKKTWKNVLIIGLAVITLVGAIVGLSALFRKSEETTKVVNPTYAVGGLTEQGKYLETEESIYTEDAFECQGLDIELDFKSNISYRVFFYDNENDFISATAKLTANYDEDTTPILAKTARIVITPNEDDKISWYEKSGYAKQLTISVDKEQKEIKLSEDLYSYRGFGAVDSATGTFEAKDPTANQGGFYFSNDINITNVDLLIVYMPQDQTDALINFYEDGSTIKTNLTPISSKVVNNYNVYTFDCKDFVNFRIAMRNAISVNPQVFAVIG